MDKFEGKYGVVEDEKVKDFHRSRWMFCIRDGEVYVAEKNLPYSHAVWFEKKGWITEKEGKLDDSIMNEIPRGFVDDQGDIYIYTGYQMGITEEIEDEFFKHFPEIVQKMGLSQEAKVCGGLIKMPSVQRFPPQKIYGTVKEVLEKVLFIPTDSFS